MVNTVNFNPSSEYDIEQRDFERRRRLAEMLRRESTDPMPGTQVISGVAVKNSPLQGVAKLAAALAAKNQLNTADQGERSLIERMQQERAATLGDFQSLMQGQPGQYEQLPPGVFGPEQELQAPTPGNPQAAMMRLMQSRDPMLSQMGTQQVMSQMMPKQGESFTLNPGAVRYDAKGNVIAKAEPKPEKPFIRTRVLGDQEVQEQLQQDGTYQEIGRGPRFARQVAPVVNVGGGMKAPSGYRFNASGELEAIRGGPADKKASQKLPTSALKMQQEELDAIGTAASIGADLSAVEKMIDDKKLNLGPVSNLASQAKNYVGASDESSRNFSTFKSTLEKLRNDSLRLNKGVQTEGDAQRAWNELVANINDPKVVKQRLGEIRKINERAVGLRRMNVDAIRSNFGVDTMDTGAYENQPPAIGNGGSNIDALLKKYGG